MELQLYWIPIRDWNKNFFWMSLSHNFSCNYIESLLGIETGAHFKPHGWEVCCNYIESLLGIETSRVRSPLLSQIRCNYIESLLGIETTRTTNFIKIMLRLQLYWIPIRDWNFGGIINPSLLAGCNYIESLLGIETFQAIWTDCLSLGCNYIESLLGIETRTGTKPTGKLPVATILNPY